VVPLIKELRYTTLVFLRQTILRLPESFFEKNFLGAFLSKFSRSQMRTWRSVKTYSINSLFAPFMERNDLFPHNAERKDVCRVLPLLHEIYSYNQSETNLLWEYWRGLRDVEQNLKKEVENARRKGETLVVNGRRVV